MKKLATITGVLVLILAGCSPADPASSAEPAPELPAAGDEEFFVAHDLAGMEAVEMIDHLDRLGAQERSAEYMASIRPDEVVFSDGEQELSVDIPEDLFYLSIAPYVNQTHECFYHSLTTCQGELIDQDLQVRIVDDATGEVLVDEQVTTFENGFAGFWLPRDIEGSIEVSYDGLTSEVDFSTGDEGATCLTTLQLT